MQRISMRDVGPIEGLEVELGEGGGVMVLRGWNGSGKSQAIRATEALIAGGGDLESRDGSLGGSVEGLGVKLTVGKRLRAKGELEVRAMEGEDPSLLVDPGVDDPNAADVRRIAALCRMTKVEPRMEEFAAEVGGQEKLEQIARPATLKKTSVAEFAAFLKRDIEERARALEAEADNTASRAAGLFQAGEGINILAPHDEHELAKAREAAVLAVASEEGAIQAYRRAVEAADKARLELAPQLEEDAAKLADLEEDAHALEAELDQLRKDLARAQADLSATRGQILQARESAALIQKFRDQIEAGQKATAPSPEKYDQLSSALIQARDAEAQGTHVRRALEQQAEGQRLMEQSERTALEGKKMRDVAHNIEEIVSRAVARASTSKLFVKDGRLACSTERGQVYFSELSHGERWKIALDAAIEAVGETGLLTIRQEAWEGLDERNRNMIAEHARERRVWILTAEASTSALRAEIYEGGPAAPRPQTIPIEQSQAWKDREAFFEGRQS